MMKNKYLKKKLSAFRLQKVKNDRMLKIFLSVFFIGYIFFFSSNYFLPKFYRNVEIVNIGQTINMEEYILSLDTWDYSKNDKAFEIIFDIENLSLEENPDYSVKMFIGDEIHMGEVYKNLGSKLVVRVDKIPRKWADVTLNVQIGDRKISLNMDDKEVHQVEKLMERSDEEYIKYAVQRKIIGMKKYIEFLEEDKKSINDRIEKAYKKITEIQEKTGQSEEENQIIENSKSKLSLEIEELKAAQDECLAKIEDITAKISSQEELLKTLG